MIRILGCLEEGKIRELVAKLRTGSCIWEILTRVMDSVGMIKNRTQQGVIETRTGIFNIKLVRNLKELWGSCRMSYLAGNLKYI